jgi:hypothetical protein
MINKQRTCIPNWFLNRLIIIITGGIILSLSYTIRLIYSLVNDNVNPIVVCEKINRLRYPDYIGHSILFFALIFRGWWQLAFLNFPFIFYKNALYISGEFYIDYTKVFSTLRNELLFARRQVRFFVVLGICCFLEWISWVPPAYLAPNEGYHVIKNLQVAH